MKARAQLLQKHQIKGEPNERQIIKIRNSSGKSSSFRCSRSSDGDKGSPMIKARHSENAAKGVVDTVDPGDSEFR